ncbi:hypothetical protein PJI20_29620, partial [Mycobacterium kansasii]
NSFGLGDCKAPKGLGDLVESIAGSIVESIAGSIVETVEVYIDGIQVGTAQNQQKKMAQKLA